MWIVADHDEKQRNRTLYLLQSEGVTVQGIGDESDLEDINGSKSVTLLLFYEGWNLVTVRRVKEQFSCEALYVGTIGQVTADLIERKIKEGYADVLSHPPQAEAAKRWEHHPEEETQAKSKSTYTKPTVLTPPGLERRKDTRGKVIALTSYGGNVGKSASASLMANALQAAGKSVVVVEVDHAGKQTLLHGLDPKVTIGSFERLSPEVPEATFRLHLVETKFHWYLIPRGQREPPISIQTLLNIIYLCSKYLDYVILDCHPDASPLSIVSAKEADHVFIITKDEVSRYGGVDELITSFELAGNPKAHLIMNNFHKAQRARQIAEGIQKTHRLSDSYLIPHDKELHRRIQVREPVVGKKSRDAILTILKKTGVL